MAIFTAAGALLRFFGLGGMGLWLDESNSVIIAAESLPGIVQRLRLDSSPILYYLILHFWIQVFGMGSLAVKSLSAVFGTLLIPATYLLGREISGRKAGLWASGLITVAPLAIYYAREVRMYSLLPFLTVLLFWSALRFLRRGGRGALAAYLAIAVCCVHTHNVGIFVWISAALLWWGVRRPSTTFRRWLLWQAIIPLLVVPWLPVLYQQLRNPTHYSWFEFFWSTYPPWAALYRTLEAFVPGGFLPSYTDLGGLAWARVWSPLLALAFLIMGIAPRRGGANDRSEPTSLRGQLPALAFIVPLFLPFLYSWVVQPVYAVGRTDTVVYPVFLILLTAGGLRMRRRAVAAAALALFTTLSLLTLVPYYGSNRRAGDREIAEHAEALTRPYDIIVCTGFARASTEYHFMARGQPRVLVSFPAEMAAHLGSLDESALMMNEDRLEQEAHDVSDFLVEELRKGRRCLILRSPMRINRFLWTVLERRFDMDLADPPGGFHQAVLRTPINVGRLSLGVSKMEAEIPVPGRLQDGGG